MSDYNITNCHIHLFTLDHVPRNFPHSLVGFLRRQPRLINLIAAGLKFFRFREFGGQVKRLGRMAAIGRKGSQEAILRSILPHYPSGTRFIILPMDIEAGGYSKPKKDLSAQHRDLFDLSQKPEFKELVLPFAKVHPNRAGAFDEFRRCIEDYGFHGLKLYPKLGYAPDDPLLMDEIYPYCVDHNLPVMTHCSRGGVYGKGWKGHRGENLGAPSNYVEVLNVFPDLRICLAHFGGNDEWEGFIKGIDPLDPDARSQNWVTTIRDMIRSGDYPNLYTDISYTMFDFEENIPFLSVFLEDEAMREKVLFGSDYYMTKQEKLGERAVSMRLRHSLGGDLYQQISQRNPSRWLTGG